MGLGGGHYMCIYIYIYIGRRTSQSRREWQVETPLYSSFIKLIHNVTGPISYVRACEPVLVSVSPIREPERRRRRRPH